MQYYELWETINKARGKMWKVYSTVRMQSNQPADSTSSQPKQSLPTNENPASRDAVISVSYAIPPLLITV